MRWRLEEIKVRLSNEIFVKPEKLYLPLDMMVGKLVTPTLVTSLEVSAPIVKDYDLYNFKLEVRIGVFF
jgi:hypothetical protein